MRRHTVNGSRLELFLGRLRCLCMITLPEAADWRPMRCTNCGSFLETDSRFCKNCGTPAHDTEETRIVRTQSSSAIAYDDDDDVEVVIFTALPTLLVVK